MKPVVGEAGVAAVVRRRLLVGGVTTLEAQVVETVGDRGPQVPVAGGAEAVGVAGAAAGVVGSANETELRDREYS
jgi:hypothetical protein